MISFYLSPLSLAFLHPILHPIAGFTSPPSIERVPEMSTADFFAAQLREAATNKSADEWLYYSGFIPEQAKAVRGIMIETFSLSRSLPFLSICLLSLAQLFLNNEFRS